MLTAFELYPRWVPLTKVAFQIAKNFVAFFTIENKHGHNQTAAKCNTDFINRRW